MTHKSNFLQPRQERPVGMARRRVDRSEGEAAPSQLRDVLQDDARPPEHGQVNPIGDRQRHRASGEIWRVLSVGAYGRIRIMRLSDDRKRTVWPDYWRSDRWESLTNDDGGAI